MDYPNFYENAHEARMRLLSTIVLYDNDPYLVISITDHMGEILRVYLQPLDKVSEAGNPVVSVSADHPTLGIKLDTYMKTNPEAGILRKHIDSPLFHKFRPFPLGMCNYRNGYAYYIERQPNRNTRQGLTGGMVLETLISSGHTRGKGPLDISIFSPEFIDCVKGTYPSAFTCLEKMTNPKVMRHSVGFHRNFALVRGPIDMLFIAYKHDVVGYLPNNDYSKIVIGKDFLHTKEVVTELNLFSEIQFKY